MMGYTELLTCTSRYDFFESFYSCAHPVSIFVIYKILVFHYHRIQCCTLDSSGGCYLLKSVSTIGGSWTLIVVLVF